MTRHRLASLLLLAGLALTAPPTAAATTSYRGKLEIRHTDDFAHGRSSTGYTLVRGRHRQRLALPASPRIASGTSVVVKGHRAGSQIKGSVRPLRARLRAAGVAAAPRKTAVILVKFGGAEPWSAEYVRQRVFTDPDSTNAFYKEDSYGDVSLVGKNQLDGDVYGWYDIPAPVPGRYGCDVNAIAGDAQAAAGGHGFVAAGYEHIIYVFPTQPLCGWAGLGEMPGTESWINGYIEPWAVAHELGHNMGLNHANSFTCTNAGAPVAISANCSSDEYGDPYDVMGEDAWHNNAWHLRQLGFLDAANVQNVTANGTYTINSTATHGGIQLLRIRRPGTSLYYDLSLRSSSGVFDTFGPTYPADEGVSIHTDPDPSAITQSLLIDTTPGSADGFSDAVLTPGRTFTDGNITITTDSVVAGVATVHVVVAPAPPADTTPPSAPGPVVAQTSADRVILSWPAASDDGGVAGYRIFRDGALVQTTTQTSWTDTSVTPGANYGYRVEAYDAAGNAASSAIVSATVPSPATQTSPPPVTTPPAPDRSAPLVAIVSPGRHAQLRRRTTVRAAAADLGGTVVRSEVWIDGKLRDRVTGGRLGWRWSLRHVRRGIHRVTVRAIDAAGNAGKASVRVRVVR